MQMSSSTNGAINTLPHLLPDSINDFRGIQDWVLQSAGPTSTGEFTLKSQIEEFRVIVSDRFVGCKAIRCRCFGITYGECRLT